MGSENFFERHKTIIVVIILIIVALIIWKYFWKDQSFTQNWQNNINWLENQTNQLESDVGINPTFAVAPGLPTIPQYTQMPNPYVRTPMASTTRMPESFLASPYQPYVRAPIQSQGGCIELPQSMRNEPVSYLPLDPNSQQMIASFADNLEQRLGGIYDPSDLSDPSDPSDPSNPSNLCAGAFYGMAR